MASLADAPNPIWPLGE